MKSMIGAVIVLSVFFGGPALALKGWVVGNGGNPTGLEFSQAATRAIEYVRANPRLFAELANVDLEGIAFGAKILVTNKPLTLQTGATVQNVVAINWKNPDTILINEDEWGKISQSTVLEGLALHEILGLAGLEESGHYRFSQRFLAGDCPSEICGSPDPQEPAAADFLPGETVTFRSFATDGWISAAGDLGCPVKPGASSRRLGPNRAVFKGQVILNCASKPQAYAILADPAGGVNELKIPMLNLYHAHGCTANTVYCGGQKFLTLGNRISNDELSPGSLNLLSVEVVGVKGGSAICRNLNSAFQSLFDCTTYQLQVFGQKRPLLMPSAPHVPCDVTGLFCWGDRYIQRRTLGAAPMGPADNLLVIGIYDGSAICAITSKDFSIDQSEIIQNQAPCYLFQSGSRGGVTLLNYVQIPGDDLNNTSRLMIDWY